MAEYKKIEVDGENEIPENWKIKHFKYIISEKIDNRGRTPELNENNDGIPIIELDAIGNKNPNVNITKKFIDEKSYKKYIRKDIKAGDILFGTVGSIGKCSIVPENVYYCIAQNIVGYRFNRMQDQLFWYYYFKSETFKQMYLQYNKGNIQDSIKISDMEQGDIIVPPLNEQKKIAIFLDKKISEVDYIIENLNSEINILNNYKKCKITEIVTNGLDKNADMKNSGIDEIGYIPQKWKISKLKYVAKCNEFTLKENTNADYNIRYVDIGSVNYENGIQYYQEMKFADSPSRARRIVQKGNTIISTVRTYLKAIAYIEDDDNVIVSTGFAVLKPKKEIYNDKFFNYYIKSERFIEQVNKYSYGITYPAINTDLLNNLLVIIPSIEEQKQISKYLDKECTKINEMLKAKQKQIRKLEDYKQSLIDEYVTGKKRVKGA